MYSGREGEVPAREVRAGSQGRRWAGRVAEPRRDAGLRRGGHRGADHWQRRASGVGCLLFLLALADRTILIRDIGRFPRVCFYPLAIKII